MELWIAWVAVGISLLSPVGALLVYKLQSVKAQERDKVRVEKVEEAMDKHDKDEFPHKNCAVHATKLDYLCDTVKDIKSSLDTLDQRIYDKFQNGGKSAPAKG